jgi:hypothetical protein
MTHARAARAAGFKRCCLLNGDFDGSDRDSLFQGREIALEFSTAATR